MRVRGIMSPKQDMRLLPGAVQPKSITQNPCVTQQNSSELMPTNISFTLLYRDCCREAVGYDLDNGRWGDGLLDELQVGTDIVADRAVLGVSTNR